MRVVVDASVALKWVFDEPESEAAVALRAEDLVAPALWLAEAANALWRRSCVGDITPDEASSLLFELHNAPVASLAMEPHLDRALKLATEIGHPVYDCIYLALAVHHDTHVVTADRRFAAAATAAGLTDRVRLLSLDPSQAASNVRFARSQAPAQDAAAASQRGEQSDSEAASRTAAAK